MGTVGHKMNAVLLYPVGRPGVFWWTWTVYDEFELQSFDKVEMQNFEFEL